LSTGHSVAQPIALGAAAFEALGATLPGGHWLERGWVDKLKAMRGPGESYSDRS
jgi:hypothetical protein